MDDLFNYFLRITPGLSIVIAVFVLMPRKLLIAKIFLLIIGFILMRDAMTPVGFWEFGISESVIWLRFIDSSLILIVLGVLSLIASLLLLKIKDLKKLVKWGNLRSWETYVMGLAVGLIVATPFILLGINTPIDLRGGEIATTLLPALAIMSFAGNFLEELVFRGFLQSYLEKHTSTIRAALLSGLMFAVAHIFLASTVTSLGLPVILFVAIEGLACAFVYRKYGLISSTIVHGLVIFMLASGLF